MPQPNLVKNRSAYNPWTGATEVASRCWCCHKDFTENDALKVVDAHLPKVVHDQEPCASAMIQMVQGQ